MRARDIRSAQWVWCQKFCLWHFVRIVYYFDGPTIFLFSWQFWWITLVKKSFKYCLKRCLRKENICFFSHILCIKMFFEVTKDVKMKWTFCFWVRNLRIYPEHIEMDMCVYIFTYIYCIPFFWTPALLFGADDQLENQMYLEFRPVLILDADQQTIKKQSLLPASSAWQKQAGVC